MNLINQRNISNSNVNFYYDQTGKTICWSYNNHIIFYLKTYWRKWLYSTKGVVLSKRLFLCLCYSLCLFIILYLGENPFLTLEGSVFRYFCYPKYSRKRSNLLDKISGTGVIFLMRTKNILPRKYKKQFRRKTNYILQ